MCRYLMALLLLQAAGCVDVRNFEGAWQGSVIAEQAVREGFEEDVRVAPLRLSGVRLQAVTARLTTTDRKFVDSELTQVPKAAADALASLTFDGDPLRSYLLFAPLQTDPQGAPAMVVLSLFGDDHVELRLIRGTDLFGVFFLRREQ